MTRRNYNKMGVGTSPQSKGYRKNFVIDKEIQAKPTGKRISNTGNVYYEYRDNRTDTPKDSPTKKSYTKARQTAYDSLKNDLKVDNNLYKNNNI